MRLWVSRFDWNSCLRACALVRKVLEEWHTSPGWDQNGSARLKSMGGGAPRSHNQAYKSAGPQAQLWRPAEINQLGIISRACLRAFLCASLWEGGALPSLNFKYIMEVQGHGCWNTGERIRFVLH